MNQTYHWRRKIVSGVLTLLLLAATAGGVGAGGPQEAEKVRQAIEAYVKQDIALKGAFFLEDPGTGKVHRLDFDHVHQGVEREPDGSYYACVDFLDAQKNRYDVDVYVTGDEEKGLETSRMILHKVNGKDVKGAKK